MSTPVDTNKRTSGPGTSRSSLIESRPTWPRLLRRGPMERVASCLIGAGVLMLLQPFALGLYTYSFVTTLAGTLMFMVVSKFPD